MDKAGAYALQGIAGMFISEVRGTPSGVIGLPLPLTRELLAFCGRRKTQGWNENTDRARLLISSAAEKMAREWARNEPVETYAALCGFDIYRFTHEFSALYGVSPLQYRISIRLRHASEYLKGTALSVRDIAELCGYDDPLYFSRIFAKRFGISPREFRKENRKEERSESASG